MDLFRWVAIETASRLGYPYPMPADEYSTGLVKTLARKADDDAHRRAEDG
jgi:hypothetical protein